MHAEKILSDSSKIRLKKFTYGLSVVQDKKASFSKHGKFQNEGRLYWDQVVN